MSEIIKSTDQLKQQIEDLWASLGLPAPVRMPEEPFDISATPAWWVVEVLDYAKPSLSRFADIGALRTFLKQALSRKGWLFVFYGVQSKLTTWPHHLVLATGEMLPLFDSLMPTVNEEGYFGEEDINIADASGNSSVVAADASASVMTDDGEIDTPDEEPEDDFDDDDG